uniref:Uncharacterized protein n=1 Tax=Rhizophora mucronata TaxID=61149 RepID=A0A2P2MX85_RHIMU
MNNMKDHSQSVSQSGCRHNQPDSKLNIFK